MTGDKMKIIIISIFTFFLFTNECSASILDQLKSWGFYDSDKNYIIKEEKNNFVYDKNYLININIFSEKFLKELKSKEVKIFIKDGKAKLPDIIKYTLIYNDKNIEINITSLSYCIKIYESKKISFSNKDEFIKYANNITDDILSTKLIKYNQCSVENNEYYITKASDYINYDPEQYETNILVSNGLCTYIYGLFYKKNSSYSILNYRPENSINWLKSLYYENTMQKKDNKSSKFNLYQRNIMDLSNKLQKETSIEKRKEIERLIDAENYKYKNGQEPNAEKK